MKRLHAPNLVRFLLAVLLGLASSASPMQAQDLWTEVAGKLPGQCALERSPRFEPVACLLVDLDAADRMAGSNPGTVIPARHPGGFVMERAVRRGHGDVTLAGFRPERPTERLQWTTGHGVAFGWMQDGGVTYEVRPGADGFHVLYRMHETARLDDRVIPAPMTGRAFAEGAAAYGEGRPAIALGDAVSMSNQITVFVAYTEAARRKYGASALLTMIQSFEDWTNQAIAQVGHPEITVKVVGTAETAYTEASSLDVDLDALYEPADGHMDELHGARAALGADLLHLLVSDSSDSCGIAYLSHDMRPDLGVGVTAADCGADTFAHEVGHNFGMGHDTYVAVEDNHWPWAYGYIDPGYRFRTIMAYDDQCDAAGRSCPTIQYYSDPNLTYQGFVVGIPYASGARTADNTRVLEDMAATIDDYGRYLHPLCDWSARSISAPTSLQAGVSATFRATLRAGSAGCQLERIRFVLADVSVSPVVSWPVATFEISGAANEDVAMSTTFTKASIGVPSGSYEPRVLIVREGIYWYLNNPTVVNVEQDVFPRPLDAIAAWPNPARDVLTLQIRSEDGRPVTVSLFDVLGRQIGPDREVWPGEVRLDVSSLVPGAYFARVRGSSFAIRPFQVVR